MSLNATKFIFRLWLAHSLTKCSKVSFEKIFFFYCLSARWNWERLTTKKDLAASSCKVIIK